ncbi:MAG: APC family permease [Acidobacteria bacterium]|nr:APC family permease [Acidobacteriota bacterium]
MNGSTGSSWLKRLLIGRPIATAEDAHRRLPKRIALPVFASDAISSTAYATEEILIVFLSFAGIGMAAYSQLVPISLMVVVLLAIVVSSYRQTLHAYPHGGGSYAVTKENLGEYPSLIAGGSLLVDYVLTVCVSVAGGTAAIISAFNGLAPYRIQLCLGFVALMMVANLRGLKESGKLFAPPTYFYVACLLTLIVVGLWRVYFQDLPPIAHEGEAQDLLEMQGAVTAFYFLKAFASGAVALTGVEAVSNGVPAFEKPEPKNASTVLIMMAVILGTSFFGLSVLAQHLQPVKDHEGTIKNTVLAQLAEQVYGGRNVFFFATQFATFAILILAANTAYADFPRISAILARDNYLPRQLMNRGDRLVFSNGVIFLSVAAGGLLVAFGGLVNALIPLYAVGVFTGFTLSQAGMCVHHVREKEPRWKFHIAINAIGALTTFFVAGTVVTVKFTDGAWIPAIVIPSLMIGFKAVNRHYVRVRTFLEPRAGYEAPFQTHFVIVLVGTVNQGVLRAIKYAESLRPDRLIAMSVVQSDEDQQQLAADWAKYGINVELQTIFSPYREIADPVLERINELEGESEDDLITVVIPEFVTSIRSQWLHNQTALSLKARLLYRPHTVVTSVPIVIPYGEDSSTY